MDICDVCKMERPELFEDWGHIGVTVWLCDLCLELEERAAELAVGEETHDDPSR